MASSTVTTGSKAALAATTTTQQPAATAGDKDQAMPGIHHVTAISGKAERNLEFYTRVLGMRFVKKTVNFDDPGTYHLYYGDEAGRPLLRGAAARGDGLAGQVDGVLEPSLIAGMGGQRVE